LATSKSPIPKQAYALLHKAFTKSGLVNKTFPAESEAN